MDKIVKDWICKTDADHQDKLLACGAIIVARLRMNVLKETTFTCSAGIAHNKVFEFFCNSCTFSFHSVISSVK